MPRPRLKQLSQDGATDGQLLLWDNAADKWKPDAFLHKAKHIRTGSDEIDGDKIDIDFTPTNYTPDVTPAEVTHVDELTAHLAGIDNLLTAFVHEKTLTADQLLSPNSADWAVNALAPLAADSNNAAISCRLFDDTIEEGAGFMVMVPSGVTSMNVKLKHRAETGAAGNKKVAPKLYNRGLPDDAAVQTWSAGNTFADLVFPNNENWQYDEETFTLAAMGVTAGEMTQFQMTRVAAAGSELSGDWTLQSIGLEFT